MLRILLLNGLILLKYHKEVQKILGWISSVMIPAQPAFACSKLTIKTPVRRHWRRSDVFIVNLEHISHLGLVFLLLTSNM